MNFGKHVNNYISVSFLAEPETCLSKRTGSALKGEGLQRHGLKAVLDAAASESNLGFLAGWLVG